jgi:uncharacterized cupredoxin-like copper-binding protein
VRKVLMIVLTLMVMLLVACGSQDPTQGASQGSGDGGHDMNMQDDDFDFGQAGGTSPVDREIKISALDSLRFDPDEIKLTVGETIKFVVRNDGKNVHEFVLGDDAYQEQHAEEMAGEHGMEEGSNWVEIAPGETKEITWAFTAEGEVLFACHEPGHYDGGMVGTIEVSP